MRDTTKPKADDYAIALCVGMTLAPLGYLAYQQPKAAGIPPTEMIRVTREPCPHHHRIAAVTETTGREAE